MFKTLEVVNMCFECWQMLGDDTDDVIPESDSEDVIPATPPH